MSTPAPDTIEAEFIMDYTQDDPRRLVRFTMDKSAVATLRHMIYTAGTYGEHTGVQRQQTENAFAMAAFLGRVETELGSRSLDSMEDFKASKPEPGSNL